MAYPGVMPKASKSTRRSANLVSVTTLQDAAGVPVDGALLSTEGLEAAVQDAVNAMSWLEASDMAMVELALEYARQIDAARAAAKIALDHAREDPSFDPAPALGVASKALYLGPHLHNTLRALGGAPEDRRALQQESGDGEPANPFEAMMQQVRDERGA